MLQTAEGETWEHHFRAGGSSKRFAERIGDPGLAEETAGIEEDRSLSSAESRQRQKRCAGVILRRHR
ncbi:hypothetical protein ATB98_22780 [Sinorhizobium saheli]|uniref:Uncharacterized protein n=1 Tax=Sinorhizobium saheli TaxID=36856 RepID=A0A178XFY0_SINSA|nr:hypothetical protein ATB98_22780 [Sinorhizobium saheli]